VLLGPLLVLGVVVDWGADREQHVAHMHLEVAGDALRRAHHHSLR
jgi:hypothetical protein